MLRNLVIRILFGLALVAGLGALAGVAPSPLIVPDPSPPTTGPGPVQPTVKGISGILNNMGGGLLGGSGFNNSPDGSQVPNTRPVSGQFAKSRTATAENDLLQFASTDPDQVIQITQSKLGDDALLRQGVLGPVNLWISSSVSFVDSTLANNVYDGHIVVVMPGIDAQPLPGLLVGFGLPYQFGNLDFQQDVSERSFGGVGIVPYASWRPADDWVISLSGGMSWFNNDVTMNGNGSTGEFKSQTMFGRC